MKTNIIALILCLQIMACNNAANSYESTNQSAVYGIDISHYQGNEIDFFDKQKDSLTFIICKATEGITGTDTYFKNNWSKIQQKGFTAGAYHFYHCKDDNSAQVAHYLSAVGLFQKNNFPPIVDFEELSIDSGCSVATIQTKLLQFLTILQQKTERMPIIYTDNNTANLYLTEVQFSKYSLWIANYDNASTPQLPNVWKNNSWTIWQKSDSYEINSITNDFDVFNGNKTAFTKFIQTH